MAVLDFSVLHKSSSRSFHDQKALIKKVLLGKDVKCKECGNSLLFHETKAQESAEIRCSRGCYSIVLDLT